VRLIQALPFVPADQVINYYEEVIISYYDSCLELENFHNNEDEIGSFMTYVERTWIGAPYGRNNRRRQPLFQIASWNHYDSVLAGRSITNNECEGFNSSWTGSLPPRPSLYNVLDHFIQRDSWAEKTLQEESVAVGGNSLDKSTSRALHRQQRRLDLQAICKDFAAMPPTYYMERLVGCLREF
jgi:hypothetical protein